MEFPERGEPTVVPRLVGLTAEVAEGLLLSHGLVPRRDPEYAPDDAMVIDQSIAPGGGQIGDPITIILAC